MHGIISITSQKEVIGATAGRWRKCEIILWLILFLIKINLVPAHRRPADWTPSSQVGERRA